MAILKVPEKSQLAARMASKKVRDELWMRGEILPLLLDQNQHAMVNEFLTSNKILHFFLCSRRLGKTYTLCALAVRQALSKPYARIKIISGTKEAVREFILPNMNQVLREAPKGVAPEYKVHESKFIFPNGSEIKLFGVDKDPDAMRGQGADMAIFDEACFIDNLNYTIQNVINPMIIESGGRILLASTPPIDPEHDSLAYIEKCRRERTLTVRTVYDCPRFSKKQIAQFIEVAGGVENEVCQREYLCKIVLSKDSTVIPEFNEITMKDLVVNTIPRRPYLTDKYVSLDPGMADNAAILYGLYDFESATLYIQREHVAKGNNTEELAARIKVDEHELWNGLKPRKRVSDTDLRLIEDLRVLHRLQFQKAEKRDKEVRINALRIAFKNSRIKIHKSCTNLIAQLQSGRWKVSSSGKREFRRSEELGHLDAIDALLYMWQSINFYHNPIPEEKVMYEHASYTGRRNASNNKTQQALKSAFR